MRQRIISALVLLPLLAIVWFSDWAFALLAGIIALLGIREFYNMVARTGGRPVLLLGFLFTSLFIANAYFNYYFEYYYTAPLIAAALVLPLIWLLILFPREEAFIHWAWTLVGMFYVGWMLSYYVALYRIDEGGKEWVLLVLLSTFACDIAALFIGRAWGRHRLAPKISPGKTWEGAIGGFIAALTTSLIIYTVLDIADLDYIYIILVGCLIGFFAQVGDLAESLVKRKVGVKDSGNLIPGHGGILDRIDSLAFSGIIAYYYVIWVV